MVTKLHNFKTLKPVVEWRTHVACGHGDVYFDNWEISWRSCTSHIGCSP